MSKHFSSQDLYRKRAAWRCDCKSDQAEGTERKCFKWLQAESAIQR